MRSERILKAQKWNLVVIHVLLLLGACVLIALCSKYFDSLRYIGAFTETDKILILIITLICTSGLLALLSILGFYAVITLKMASVNWYSVSMALVLMFNLTSGILIFTYQDSITSEVRDNMVSQAKVYTVAGLSNNEAAATLAWDNTQLRFKCCGVNNFKDWRAYRPQLRGSPNSCSCKTEEEYCNQELNVFDQGCYKRMVEDGNVFLFAIAGVTFGISFLQLCAVRLLEKYKRDKEDLELRVEFFSSDYYT
ncbi:tetraspanin-6-like [Cloeon dipterum]|uniref:tetraspanin-6-like n=1 Tax=Cloeon dipterum TaxID=197152 RepID=UPI003220915A